MIPREEYKNIVDKMPILCVDAIIVNSEGKYLLIKRENEPLKGEYWIVGGRVIKGEMVRNAIIRKIQEETGLNVDIIREVGYYEEHFDKTPFGLESGVHTLSVVFLARVIDGEVKLDEQSSDYKWSDTLPQRFIKNLFHV